MTYLIEPSVFYWMQVLDAAKSLSVVMAIISFIVATIAWGAYITDGDEDDKTWLRTPRVASVVVFILSVLAATFIPSKETLITMLVAKAATVENVGWTVDALKEVVDYIVEAIAKIKG